MMQSNSAILFDDRSLVSLPYDDWGHAGAYELMSDGTAVERFDTVGDVFRVDMRALSTE